MKVFFFAREPVGEICNRWHGGLIFSNSMRMLILAVSGAPLEELQEKYRVGPQLQFFFSELELLELDTFGMTCWWSSWSGALLNTPYILEH